MKVVFWGLVFYERDWKSAADEEEFAILFRFFWTRCGSVFGVRIL